MWPGEDVQAGDGKGADSAQFPFACYPHCTLRWNSITRRRVAVTGHIYLSVVDVDPDICSVFRNVPSLVSRPEDVIFSRLFVYDSPILRILCRSGQTIRRSLCLPIPLLCHVRHGGQYVIFTYRFH